MSKTPVVEPLNLEDLEELAREAVEKCNDPENREVYYKFTLAFAQFIYGLSKLIEAFKKE